MSGFRERQEGELLVRKSGGRGLCLESRTDIKRLPPWFFAGLHAFLSRNEEWASGRDG